MVGPIPTIGWGGRRILYLTLVQESLGVRAGQLGPRLDLGYWVALFSPMNRRTDMTGKITFPYATCVVTHKC